VRLPIFRAWLPIPVPFSFSAGQGWSILRKEHYRPELVVRDGEVITPDCGLLADVMAPSERPSGVTRPSFLGGRVANIAAQ
jgi:hypothetical protein